MQGAAMYYCIAGAQEAWLLVSYSASVNYLIVSISDDVSFWDVAPPPSVGEYLSSLKVPTHLLVAKVNSIGIEGGVEVFCEGATEGFPGAPVLGLLGATMMKCSNSANCEDLGKVTITQ